MFKSSIAVSVLLAGGLMFSGCSDLFDFSEDDVYDTYSTSGNYAYCAYYPTSSSSIRDTCTQNPYLYDSSSNQYAGSCSSQIYSYSYCSTYMDTYASPAKAQSRIESHPTVDESVSAYENSVPTE